MELSGLLLPIFWQKKMYEHLFGGILRAEKIVNVNNFTYRFDPSKYGKIFASSCKTYITGANNSCIPWCWEKKSKIYLKTLINKGSNKSQLSS